MEKERIRIVKSCFSNKLFLFLLFWGLIWTVGITQVHAEYDEDYEEYVLELKSAQGLSATQVEIDAVLDEYIYSYDVYRADTDPSRGGVFHKIDTVSYSSGWWKSGSSEYWCQQGKNNVIYAYSKNPYAEDKVDVILMDHSGNLGHTYYYKVVTEGVVYGSQISSNVVSAQTKLEIPDLVKCCTTDGKTVKLKWYPCEKAQGYQIYRKDSRKWKKIKTIKKGKTYTYTDKKVKKGKTYQYKVRAYSKVGGKTCYSSFAKVQKVSLKAPSVKGNYSPGSVYGPYLGSKELLQVKRVVQSFKSNYITTGMSDYQKVLAAYNYLRSNCIYAWKGWQYNNANTAWGALVYGEAQCSGYARAMKALCDAIGVPCYYVHANSKAINPSHQWNEVKVGRKWYVLDAQSGAFLFGYKSWQNMGMRWNTKGLPKCSKTDYKKK